MTPSDLGKFMLFAAMISMVPGLWACWRKRYLVGGVLAVGGFFAVGCVAVVSVGMGIVAHGDFPAEAIIWSSITCYWIFSVAVVVLTTSARTSQRRSD
ncbi:MAG: hypothetical protein QM759_14460 [Terricaulis sp.]